MQSEFDAILEKMFSGKERPSVLLAVSGGMDSMCMANLVRYSSLDMKASVAHVNFSLRGEESDSDESLVRAFADDWGVDLYVRRFDTLAYAAENSVSVEMAARDLRYRWFAELIDEHGFDYLLIAHNANDSVETLFLNIVRGTGLRGLSGIKPVNGNILRPLLGFKRRNIADYVHYNKVPYHDDRTNFESEYSRNKLRNIVFPELEKINSSFLNTVSRDMAFFTQASEILDDLYMTHRDRLLKKICLPDGTVYYEIDVKRLKGFKSPAYWLFRLLEPFGFNSSQVLKIYEVLDGQPGKEFFSPSYCLLKDRNVLKIYGEAAEYGDETVHALPYECGGHDGTRVSVISSSGLSADQIKGMPISVHVIDESRLVFPLHVRKWRRGDRFKPLGMDRFKKISDFLVDRKIDRFSKRNVRVLVNVRADGTEEIVAVLGLRTDNRYRAK